MLARLVSTRKDCPHDSCGDLVGTTFESLLVYGSRRPTAHRPSSLCVARNSDTYWFLEKLLIPEMKETCPILSYAESDPSTLVWWSLRVLHEKRNRAKNMRFARSRLPSLILSVWRTSNQIYRSICIYLRETMIILGALYIDSTDSQAFVRFCKSCDDTPIFCKDTESSSSFRLQPERVLNRSECYS